MNRAPQPGPAATAPPPRAEPAPKPAATGPVSVIIPAFNHEKFILEAIASASAQGECVGEIIVVDDGSTDRTAALVEQLHEPRLRLLRQRNAGPSAARNTGWRAARGEWIQFLDADDTLPPHALAALLAAAHLAPGKIPFGLQTVHGPDLTSAPAFTAVLASHGGNLLEDIALRYHSTIFTALIPRAALKSIGGFRENIRCGEDFDLALRLALHHEFTALAQPTYRARMHGQNRHTKFSAFAREQYLEIVHDNLGANPDPAARRHFRRALANWLWHLGRRAQHDGNPARAHGYFRQSWLEQPFKLGAWRGWCETLFARRTSAARVAPARDATKTPSDAKSPSDREMPVNHLPLPARHERGEGREEGPSEAPPTSSPQPSPPTAGGEGDGVVRTLSASQKTTPVKHSTSTDADELHQRLRAFYNESPEYFAEASCVNRELTPERAELFRFIKNGDRVLDVGCGSCDNAHALAARTTYCGCDISHLALRRGATAAPEFRLRLAQGESQRLPFADASFSVVLSTYALEHFVFPRESLDEMWRVCRPGGKIILISPAYDDPRLLPPSTSHWSTAARCQLLLAQAWRQAVRHLNPRQFYFARVQRPRVLSEKYQSDFDAVHLVSAREIAAYFRAQNATFHFERKRLPRPVTSGSLTHRLREHLRNCLLRAHLGEYAGLNLQLVVEKPAP